jgi:hypothetical protein
VSSEIKQYIDRLVPSLGRVNPPINPDDLLKMHRAKNHQAMVQWIQKSMRLDLRVEFTTVDDKNRPPL